VPESETMNAARRAEIVERVSRLQTAIVCDVYDERGWDPRAVRPDLHRVTAHGVPLVGFAATIVGRQERFDGPDRAKLAAADALPPDSVAVWSGTDAGHYCLFGDLIAATMQGRGCRGAIVDGGIRDVAAIDATGFPVQARHVTPLQGLGRWRVTEVGGRVTLPSAYGDPITVRPGDLVFGDADGVVVVEAERIDEVVERAEAILAAEAEARALSEEGMSASEMLEKFGHV
jgi:4-hydroxy-4-methyl-2-oxoglutarate aldolase